MIAASGMENALSGGEVPYQFADDTGESSKLGAAFVLHSCSEETVPTRAVCFAWVNVC